MFNILSEEILIEHSHTKLKILVYEIFASTQIRIIFQNLFIVDKDYLQYGYFSAGTERTMVFVETKRQADFIAAHLCQENVPTTSIHGYVMFSSNSSHQYILLPQLQCVRHL